MNILKIFSGFFLWWYTNGLLLLLEYIFAINRFLLGFFSVKESLKNIFSPWKKLVGERRPGLDGLKDWLLDNLVSRGIGFVMRFFLLGFYVVSFLISSIFCIILIAIWVGWPLLIIVSILWEGKNV